MIPDFTNVNLQIYHSMVYKDEYGNQKFKNKSVTSFSFPNYDMLSESGVTKGVETILGVECSRAKLSLTHSRQYRTLTATERTGGQHLVPPALRLYFLKVKIRRRKFFSWLNQPSFNTKLMLMDDNNNVSCAASDLTVVWITPSVA